jgi:sulfite exporter TauE/SafE
MIGGLVVSTSGLIAGALHVLAGPDHLAAIAPLAADSRRSLWRSGLLWGVGHTGGVLVVGALVLALRGLLPIDHLSAVSERVVGIALIVVGLWGLRRAVRARLHVHAHDHDGAAHTHVHVHDETHRHQPDRAGLGADAHDHVHASFLFGVLHGFAGSSHVFGILPALALPTRAASVTYMVAYGIGTVVAMTIFSSCIGLAAARARSYGVVFYRTLLYACSAAAIVVGGVWLLV